MPLEAGTRLGPYEIAAQVGAGGMGEVYRARDTRLGREVAVKVLPDDLSADPQFQQRFEREARTISQLQHPNVCTLHDVGSHEGLDYLVMELLEGETLEERLHRGALPVSEALRIGAEIAEGIEAAHRQGLVHRDLKPGNVMLTSSGTKILDFGLARDGALPGQEVVDTVSPTRPAITEEGGIVGTLPYMAPEQLQGGTVDGRADIWGLGCMLYEMATGARPFAGRSRADLVASILGSSPPPPSQREPEVPERLDWVVERCLEKDRERRWQSARDVAIELERVGTVDTPAHGTAQLSRTTSSRWGAASAAAVLVASVVALAWAFLGRRPEAELPDISLSVELPWGQELSAPPALSRDGRSLALATRDASGRGQLYLRELGSFELHLLATRGEISEPFFSPNGEWIGFASDRQLWKVATSGGQPIHLADAPTVVSTVGASWGVDGFIVFSLGVGRGLLRVSENGGPTEVFTELDRDRNPLEYAHVHPRHLPDGSLLFGAWGGPYDLVHVDASGDELERLPLWFSGTFATTGHLLQWDRQAGIQAAAWQPSRGEPPGTMFQVLPRVFFDFEEAVSYFSVSAAGPLAFAGAASSDYELAWVRLDGSVDLVDSGPGYDSYPSLSPDGQRVVYKKKTDLWLLDVATETKTPLVSGFTTYFHPHWTPDGKAVYFGSNETGEFELYRVPADGTGSPELVLERPGFQVPQSVSPGGDLLFIDRSPQKGDDDVWVLPSDGEPIPFLATSAHETAARFSPDGRFVAYVSDESGSNQVYVVPYQAEGQKHTISKGGGIQPEWSNDGRLLFYRQGDEIMAVEIELGPQFRVGKSERIFGARPFAWEFDRYDVSLDGQRLLMVYRPPEAIADRVDVVLNGLELIRSLEPAE